MLILGPKITQFSQLWHNKIFLKKHRHFDPLLNACHELQFQKKLMKTFEEKEILKIIIYYLAYLCLPFFTATFKGRNFAKEIILEFSFFSLKAKNSIIWKI